MSTVAAQKHDTLAMFAHVERLEEIAAGLDERDAPAARKLYELADEVVSAVSPVRISIAADLLKVSRVTVQAWCRRGVLKAAEPSKVAVRTLDPHRLHDVLHLVKELRELGEKPGGLAEQVWYRLEDRALADSEELQKGLEAWRSGDVVDA
jgi:hypothetical protein